jgi:hypothetical protein
MFYWAKFLSLSLVALMLAAIPAQAQVVFFQNTRVGSTVHTHTTVGTTSAAAITSTSVSPNLLGWQLCNDAVNTSTYLLVGKATDVADDGIQLDKGQCYLCANCNPSTLKATRVKAQASSNGYSIVQFKQQ